MGDKAPTIQADAAGSDTIGTLAKARNLTRAAAHGAASVVKTTVLRQDRTTPAEYEARLNTCRNCPGGHATFKADGSLHTCGDMVQGMADAQEDGAPKPCGCLLKKKAMDRTESCPFGYWPTLEGRAMEHEAQAEVQPIAADANAPSSLIISGGSSALARQGRLEAPRKKKGCGCGCGKRKASTSTSEGGNVQPYSDAQMRHFLERRRAARRPQPFDPSRRRFIGTAAVAAAGLAFTSRMAWATGPGQYYKLKKCGTEETAFVKRDPNCQLNIHNPEADPPVDGIYEFKDGSGGSLGCWEVIECKAHPDTPSGTVLSCAGKVGPSASCTGCPNTCCACGPCCFGSQSYVTVEWSHDITAKTGLVSLSQQIANFVVEALNTTWTIPHGGGCRGYGITQYKFSDTEFSDPKGCFYLQQNVTYDCGSNQWTANISWCYAEAELEEECPDCTSGYENGGGSNTSISENTTCCGGIVTFDEWEPFYFNGAQAVGTITLHNNKCCKDGEGDCTPDPENQEHGCDENGATEECGGET